MLGIIVIVGIIICVALSVISAPAHCAYDEFVECPNCYSHSNCLECHHYRKYMRDAEIQHYKFGAK